MRNDKVERRSVGIVERLRNTHARDPDVPLRVHMLEAADEIERQRQEIENLVGANEPLRSSFAELKRRLVIEECAKVCESEMFLGLPPPDYRKGWHAATRRCAAAIRALTGGGT